MYIFLDVDGVLNKESDWNRPFTLNSSCVNNFILLLKDIKDAKIILSSSWRNGIARDGSVAKHVSELMEVLKEAGITTLDKTAISPDGKRNKEIDYYLRHHEKDTYLILDDDSSLFEEGKNTAGLYLTDCALGLTESDCKKILKTIRKTLH